MGEEMNKGWKGKGREEKEEKKREEKERENKRSEDSILGTLTLRGQAAETGKKQ